MSLAQVAIEKLNDNPFGWCGDLSTSCQVFPTFLGSTEENMATFRVSSKEWFGIGSALVSGSCSFLMVRVIRGLTPC